MVAVFFVCLGFEFVHFLTGFFSVETTVVLLLLLVLEGSVLVFHAAVVMVFVFFYKTVILILLLSLIYAGVFGSVEFFEHFVVVVNVVVFGFNKVDEILVGFVFFPFEGSTFEFTGFYGFFSDIFFELMVVFAFVFGFFIGS